MAGITRGMQTLRRRIANYLIAATPPVIWAARSEWGLDPWLLPEFKAFNESDPWSLKDYPAICLDATSDSGHSRVDIQDDGSVETWPSYTVLIAPVVRTPFNEETQKYADDAFKETVRLRDDLTAIVQNVLVNNSGLLDPAEIQLDPGTINTAYYPPLPPNNSPKVFVAQSTISVVIKQRALTWQPQIGTVEEVSATATLLNP